MYKRVQMFLRFFTFFAFPFFVRIDLHVIENERYMFFFIIKEVLFLRKSARKRKIGLVGVYPDSSDGFAICDYGIGTDITDYIIVLYLDEKGELKDMTWES